jgi:ketosteroid isomerase-like protein
MRISQLLSGLILFGLPAPALFAQSNAATVLMEADRAFDRDTAARGLDGWMGWFAEDARIETNKDVLVGKAVLREYYSKMFAGREFRIHWWPVQADISADGTLGFTFGRAEVSWRDEKGEMQKRESRYTTLWRRQRDGQYKVVFDMGG